MGALLLKKRYLDETTNFERISKEKLEFIVTSTKNSILPNKSLTFIKRCCEILVKVYSKIVTIFSYSETRKRIDPNHFYSFVC
jgi:hypothetical protein